MSHTVLKLKHTNEVDNNQPCLTCNSLKSAILVHSKETNPSFDFKEHREKEKLKTKILGLNIVRSASVATTSKKVVTPLLKSCDLHNY